MLKLQKRKETSEREDLEMECIRIRTQMGYWEERGNELGGKINMEGMGRKRNRREMSRAQRLQR